MASHISEDDLTLYYYGEGRRRDEIERHLDSCPACAAVYREIAGTLAMIVAPEVPERGDQYGLEIWQRIRHRLPDQSEEGFGWFARFGGSQGSRGSASFAIAAAAAAVLIGAFIAGRTWQATPRPDGRDDDAFGPAGGAPATARATRPGSASSSPPSRIISIARSGS